MTVCLKQYAFRFSPVIIAPQLLLRLHVTLVCVMRFPSSLREGLRLDIRLVSLCNNTENAWQGQSSLTSNASNWSGGAITGKLPLLFCILMTTNVCVPHLLINQQLISLIRSLLLHLFNLNTVITKFQIKRFPFNTDTQFQTRAYTKHFCQPTRYTQFHHFLYFFPSDCLSVCLSLSPPPLSLSFCSPFN